MSEKVRPAIQALLVGSIAGTISGALTALAIPSSYLPQTARVIIQTVTSTKMVSPVTIPTSTISFIPLERKALQPLLPPAFISRRASPVASLFRRNKASAIIEDHLLMDDHLLGQAVGLTSDGWFVTTASVFGSLKVADILVFYHGRSYPIDRAIKDKSNETIFFKTTAKDVNPSAFAELDKLGVGVETWLETGAEELQPTTLTKLASIPSSREPQSSEVSARRLQLAAAMLPTQNGSAAWDPAGSLLGLAEQDNAGKTTVIPATVISASFRSLLSQNSIDHALFGIHFLDLGLIRFDTQKPDYPTQGALIRSLQHGSPADKAGLNIGDIITQLDRDQLDGTVDLGEILTEYQAGETITVHLIRDQKNLNLTVTLGKNTTSEAVK